MTRPTQHIDEVMQAGGQVKEHHKHEANPHYTVKVADKNGVEYTYTNITAEKLNQFLKEKVPAEAGAEGKMGTRSTAGAAAGGEKKTTPKKKSGTSFEACMNSGGNISDYHITSRGTYSLHVEMPDGTKHAFSSVGAEKLEQYLPVEEGKKIEE